MFKSPLGHFLVQKSVLSLIEAYMGRVRRTLQAGYGFLEYIVICNM